MTDSDSASVQLVLGASGGIGSALVRRLAARGDTVLALAPDSPRLGSLCEETGATPIVGDAREADEVGAAVKQAVDEHGRLDGAVCLVGSILLKPAHTTSGEELDEALRQNLLPAFHLVAAAAPAMGRNGGGSIALMSSAAARHGLPNHEAIAAAKGAVEGLARAAAASYAGKGVRVNAVAPGLVRTPLTERLTSSPASLEASEAMHALGRIGEADEVASLLAWLLGPEGSWATGQTFGIDGGLAAVAPRK